LHAQGGEARGEEDPVQREANGKARKSLDGSLTHVHLQPLNPVLLSAELLLVCNISAYREPAKPEEDRSLVGISILHLAKLATFSRDLLTTEPIS
jgi:hypothetical protein